jgi:hypothetical protein
MVSSSLARLILPAHSSIWRQRFKEKYDMPKGRTSTEIKIEYQARAIVLYESVSFKGGENDKSQLWLEVLRTLLLEACFPFSASFHAPCSRNLDRVKEIVCRSDFLHRPISGSGRQRAPSDQYCAIQLVRLSCFKHRGEDVCRGQRANIDN